MMRSFNLFALALAAAAIVTGCGSLPSGARSASWSSPTALVALHKDVQDALLFERTVLGTDDNEPGLDRRALEQVATRYRDLAGTAIAHSRGASDLGSYARRLDAARQRDPSFRRGSPASVLAAHELAGTVAEYHGAFRQVAREIDARIGRVERERDPRGLAG